MIHLPNEGAIFNEDRSRRWWLGRCLDRVRGVHRGRLLIIAVQPSTADETANDPTITREIKFAMSWGFLWLDKCNLFDLCSPDPATLYGTTPPVTAVNDDYIFAAATRASMILCAWGNHGAHLARGARMKRMLDERGYELHALGFTKDGFPIHPLARGKSRVPDSAQPQRWVMGRRNRSERFDRIVGRIQFLAEELATLPEVPTLHRYPITKIQGRGVLVRIDVRRPNDGTSR